MTKLPALFIATLILTGVPARADETARQILDRQRALDEGARRWNDRYEQIRMEIVIPSRPPRQLALDLFDRKFPDRQQKTMAFFSAPTTVKGTAFFAVTHPERAADQWLYLPEGKRARRIGGEARKQGFVGTDFSYHDLDLLADLPTWTADDADARLRGEAVVDGVPCHIIELTPKREDVGYQRIDLWLGRDDLVMRQVDLYETAPSTGWFGSSGGDVPPTRRIRQSDVRAVGAIPVPHHIEVETPSAGSKTIVTFDRVAFDQGLPDTLFSQQAMEWGSYQPGK